MRAGQVVECGSLRPRAGERWVDLQGAFLLPGLWDAHIHLLLLARALGQVDLSHCRDRWDLLGALQSAPGEWVEGHGWNESHWLDPRLPTPQQLDQACGGRPCFLTRSDLHSALVNGEALRRAGIGPGTPDPPGGRIDPEQGLVFDRAMLLLQEVLSWPEGERLAQLLGLAVSQLHRNGIVGVCDQRLKDVDDGPLAWETYRRLRPRLRIHCNRGGHEDLSLGPRFGEGDEWLRCGHVKFFSDGSMGSRTARLLAPYQGYPQERGLWLTEAAPLQAGVERAHSWGFPVSVHAIGDEAVGLVAGLLGAHSLDRIEHVQILHPGDLARVTVVASMQPVHLLDDRLQADMLLGERASGYYRLASLHRQGTLLSFGSDAPVASLDPWLGVQAACLRYRDADEEPWFPQECLAPSAALQAYTCNTCRSLGWAGFGELRPGFAADFCVVDRNPLQCRLPKEIRVLRTVVGGETVFIR